MVTKTAGIFAFKMQILLIKYAFYNISHSHPTKPVCKNFLVVTRNADMLALVFTAAEIFDYAMVMGKFNVSRHEKYGLMRVADL